MVKNLRKLRNRSGISQQQLANVIGISQQSINKYENHDVEPDIDMLISIANCFSTSVDYLVGHTEIDHVIENVREFDLNDDESILIENYRKLCEKEKDSIRLVIQNYSKR